MAFLLWGAPPPEVEMFPRKNFWPFTSGVMPSAVSRLLRLRAGSFARGLCSLEQSRLQKPALSLGLRGDAAAVSGAT
jgi:hypothetical protein